MTERLDYLTVAPDATKGLAEMIRFVRRGTVPPRIVELVKVRVSQMNGCSYCLGVHVPRARRFGATRDQLDTLAAWRDSTAFSARERAALAWAESVTELTPALVPDAEWQTVSAEFTEHERIELTIAVVEINAWNRLNVAFRKPPEFEAETPAPTAAPPAGSAPSPVPPGG